MAHSDLGEVNIFRRFPTAKREKMVEFYTDVLGFKALPSTALGGNAMIRIPVGNSEIKLFPVNQEYAERANPPQKTIGIRLLTFFYSDSAAVTARFKEHGYPAPQFRRRADGKTSAALVQDADGQWVELVVDPGASAAKLNRFEIGITVSDLEQSRAFYRDVLGFDESGPVQQELLGATKYAFHHGSTTLNLWSFGKDLPHDTYTAGLQYIVWDVVGVDRVAKLRGAKIDRPLSAPGSPRTVWLFDPDNVTNYFAQFAENNNKQP
jgi:catechol 2,3-dioxygenase-like lactoylglutathione lyase family enzyme